jgi:RNA polymerase sigma factor (sigma-70 family)
VTRHRDGHEVVDRASDDDVVAFTALFQLYGRQIHQYLAHRVGASEADELTSETFALAFDSRHRFDANRGSSRAWLFGIATNVLRLHFRRERRRSRAHARSASLRTHISAADAVALEATDREFVRQALDALDVRAREVTYLIGGFGLSYEETAMALGIPIGTVRSRYFRARKQLIPRLSEKSIDS